MDPISARATEPATRSAESAARSPRSRTSGEDTARFEETVHMHTAGLFRFAVWKLGNRALAEDLVQDTFVRAWQSWDSLKDRNAAKSWLYAILRNEIARSYSRSEPEPLDDSALEDMVAEAQSGAAESVEMENLLGALPETYRDPLLLQVLGGFSCAEIGDILSVSETAVMQRVSRARAALREIASDAERRPALQRI